MPDWTKSMKQTFEYYVVDPGTWRDIKQIKNVKSCTIKRDWNTETLESATIEVSDKLSECYVRIYLITTQNGIDEKFPLGTFLVQTPSIRFDGKVNSLSLDSYSPLLELKENPTPLGYSIFKGENIMDNAYRIIRDNARAPVIKNDSTDTLYNDFVSNSNDTWLSFSRDLISNANKLFDIDEMGRIMFSPKQDTASLQPVYTYNDDNSSLLYPEIDISRDLYGIPNTVEIICAVGSKILYAKSVNDDPNSPISTVNRGREILHRVTNPGISGTPDEAQVKNYSDQLLRSLSSLEYVVNYSHGYCPTRIGDCVRLNYTRAGINNVKARIIEQSIKCEPGCPVSERAIFTIKLWDGDAL